MACGTGCLGHYSVNITDGGYRIFCIGSGDLECAPDRRIAVAENYSSGPNPQGLGLVAVQSAVALAAGSTPFQYDRPCKSAFSGSGRSDDPEAAFPVFVTWLPDSRGVLYSNLKDNSLRLWDTQTGQRTIMIAGQSK